ncbi:hypothetical protein C4577_06035 [Candidatus Parcubacteria bacterium]|nr:MAG: hypothetical protein C4577_06035 [Candidatus Parcubacteria bacterium]
MKKIIKKNIYYFLLVVVVFIFFYQFFLKGFLPIPSDTIIGLYHPFRDYYSKDYPNGIPFKNFLVTDPVRQTFPWKKLALDTSPGSTLPIWNPYEMAGKPLIGNFQTGFFYPFNLIFFLKPFYLSWSIFIFLQSLFAATFMYLYLKNLNLDNRAVYLGTVSFCFSSFFISWLEWGNVIHTALWLPLILLAIDKIFIYQKQINSNLKAQNSKPQLKTQNLFVWSMIFLFSLTSSFFAGHLQIFFYLFIFSSIYFFAKWYKEGKKTKLFISYLILNTFFLILTSVQWVPTLQFILLSARGVDQVYYQAEGWFIPWQHLVQFLVPDFFGNPTTLNYWGTWNYAELSGYVGAVPLIFALIAIFFRFDKKTLFFGTALLISLLFSLPTFFAGLPYVLNIPFISSSQPTRLLFITSFCLAVLSSLGFNLMIKNPRLINKAIITSIVVGLSYAALWIFVLTGSLSMFNISPENIATAKRNLIFPSSIFLAVFFLIIVVKYFKNHLFQTIIFIAILILASFELLRFSFKFEPFTDKAYLFPETKVIEFLNSQKKPFRIASLDSRIFPPNFSTYYKLESIEGYDPLYLSSYAEFIAASERNRANVDPPFGFNRIITPRNLDSKLIDLLNVKYTLSLSEINSGKFNKVFQEGQTRIYENKDVLPRIFFTENIKLVNNKKDALNIMFEKDFDPLKLAVIEFHTSDLALYPRSAKQNASQGCLRCSVEILDYRENEIKIKTKNEVSGFLVITDTYYPTWKVLIDGKKDKIYKTNYTFRGLFIPEGEHIITMYTTLF